MVARIRATGTHKGEYMGIPPTGARISVTVVRFFRIPGGKIVENRDFADRLGLMQQIGAIS